MTKEQLHTGEILSASISNCSTVISCLNKSGACITIDLSLLDPETIEALKDFFVERKKYLEKKFTEL